MRTHKHSIGWKTRWLLLICAAAFPAAGADRTLAETLGKMDEAAGHFKGLSANITYGTHMEAIHEDDSETGTILVKRPSSKELHVKVSIEKPDAKVAIVDGKKVQVYYPSSGEIQTGQLGSRRSMVDMLLMLGFGGTSKDLQNAYTVTLGGPDTVAGEPATRLQLVPKLPEMLEQWKRIDLWISDKSGYAVQQKLYEKGNDSTLVTYTNVRPNPEIPDSAFKFEAPKGTKVENLSKKK